MKGSISLPRVGLLAVVALAALAGVDAARAQAVPVPSNTASCLTPAEASLAQLTNEYRQQNALPAIPVSFSLSAVAQWHVWDLRANAPVGGACNLHSWSNAMPALWQAMCYTADHAQAAQMWNKPRQVTANVYNSNGYEISAFNSAGMTAAGALNQWKGSPGHNAVILNQSPWNAFPWGAMGVGVFDDYAVIWFGTLADPLGVMASCGGIFTSGFEF
jgi:uncharacterized protein YkwD